MRHLLYGILSTPKQNKIQPLLGINRNPVFLVAENNLSAAVSPIGNINISSSTSELLVYAHVVEAIHQYYSIIPMRFGCIFEDIDNIIQLLKEDHEFYSRLLGEIKNSVEIGIRVILPRRDKCSSQQSVVFSKAKSGKDYLMELQNAYKQRSYSADVMQDNKVGQMLLHALSGCYIRYKEEYFTSKEKILSFYFLVDRNSINYFRVQFEKFKQNNSFKLMITGSWPPYNFV